MIHLSNFRRHLLLTHDVGDRKKDCICTVCGKAYYYAYLLKDHMICHTEDRPFACPECRISFKTKLDLHHHNISLHSVPTNAKLQKCKYCLKQFRDKHDRVRHEFYVHRTPKGAKPFPCKYNCGMSYKREHSMGVHCRDACPNRPYTAENGDEVEEAVEAITNDSSSGSKSTKPKIHPPKKKIKPFSCEYNCGAKFKARGVKSRYYLHLHRWCPLRSKDKGNKEKESMLEIVMAEGSEEILRTGENSETIETKTVTEEPVEMDLMNIIDQIE